MTGRTCLCLAGCLGFIAVFLGAFGAHGLKDTKYLTDKYAEMEPKIVAGYAIPASYKYAQDFETGVEYHMVHVLAMLATGLLLLQQHPSRWLSVAAWCFLGGIIFFSGALYVLVIGGPRWLGIPWGMVAPIGGTLQLLGWLAFAAGAWRMQNNVLTHQR